MNPEEIPTTPDERERLRREIAQRRADMGRTVAAIEYRVRPSNVASRQLGRMRGGFQRARTTVMGSPDYDTRRRTGEWREKAGGYANQAREQAGDYREQVAGYAQDAAEGVREAPDRAIQATRGNPLAAGMIAFGLGALIGSLPPASETERRAARGLREEFEEPLREELQSSGEQMQEHVQQEAQRGVEQVKETAQDAAGRVKGEAQSQAGAVQEQAQDATREVREQR